MKHQKLSKISHITSCVNLDNLLMLAIIDDKTEKCDVGGFFLKIV